MTIANITHSSCHQTGFLFYSCFSKCSDIFFPMLRWWKFIVQGYVTPTFLLFFTNEAPLETMHYWNQYPESRISIKPLKLWNFFMMIFFKYSLGKQTTRARLRINQTNMDFLKSLICWYDFMVQTAWKIVKVCWPIPYFITFSAPSPHLWKW